MMRDGSKRYALAGLLLISAAFGIYVFSHTLNSKPVLPEASTAPASNHGELVLPAVVSVSPAIETPALAQRKATPYEAMQQSFAAAHDWRAFARSAIEHPEQGGRFYGMYVAKLCGRSLSALKKWADKGMEEDIRNSGTISSEKLSMVESFNARCSSFLPGEAAELYMSLLGKSDDNDRLYQLQGLVLQAFRHQDSALLRKFATELLQQNDPLLLSQNDLLIFLVSYTADAPRNLNTFWFDRKTYAADDETGKAELSLALRLSACREGTLCDMDDQRVLSCTGQSICSSDRIGYVKSLYQQLPGASEAGFTRVIGLARRARQAIDNADVDVFLRPQ